MIRFGKLTMAVFLSSGTFRLSGVFNVTGRGSVLMGNLLDGEINSGDFLIFPSELGDRWVKIDSVEYVDHLQTLSTELALMVRLESKSLKECVGTLPGQDLTVTKGLDF